jgi:ATP-dependent Clp protease ATP-binding subunit ClpA
MGRQPTAMDERRGIGAARSQRADPPWAAVDLAPPNSCHLEGESFIGDVEVANIIPLYREEAVFERYTEKARRVIFFARYEASQFGSPHVESEHLLLGLLRESKALSARLFAGSPGAIDKIRKQVEGRTISGEKVPSSVDLLVSDECKRILLYASEEADALAHKHIGTEHVLLGMLREQDSDAAQLLNENGVALESVRARIAGAPREEAASPSKSPGMPAGYIWQQLLYNPAQRYHRC